MQWNQNYYEELIHKVDAFTRKYYINQLIRGSLYFIGLVTVVFLAFNLLEHYFYFSKAVRKILFFSFIGLFGLSLWHWVITPMMHYFKLGKLISQEEAAKIIGTHFSNVKDKLINVLQLKSQSVGYTDRTLIDASIQQKASELKPVPFVAAIDLQKNRKYIQYAILPLFLLGSLWLWSPSLIKDPTTRLIQNDKEFEREALFHFELSAQELKARQNSDFSIHAKVSGTVMPSEAFIVIDQFPYRMQKISDDEVYLYKTNPFAADTDGDGYIDGAEITLGYDPLDSTQETLVAYESPRDTGILRDDLLSITDVITLTKNDDTERTRALFSGVGLPNSFVTLYIYSTPVIVTVRTSPDGGWSYIFDKELEDGAHEVYIGITDNAGNVVAKSSPFAFTKTAEAFTKSDSIAGALQAQKLEQSFFSTDNMLLVGSISIIALGLILLLLGVYVRSRKSFEQIMATA